MAATEGTPKNDHAVAKAIKPYVCGGSAAMFASFCIHPIDLVKVRLQLIGQGSKASKRPSGLAVATAVIKEEGPQALYAGLTASLGRQATYGTARIGLYSAFTEKLRVANGGENIPAYQKFLAGFLSGAMASAVGNPFDVSLVRMQADGMKPLAERRGYTSIVGALTTIVRTEGFNALYHGYPPTLLRAISMNIGMMMSYDQTKEMILKVNGPALSTDLASSAAAGFFCAFLSLPFDLMKTRLQNMKPDANGEMPYKNVMDCGVKIFRNEGVLAFWRGFGAYYGRCAPHAMIILLVREQIIKGYDRYLLS